MKPPVRPAPAASQLDDTPPDAPVPVKADPPEAPTSFRERLSWAILLTAVLGTLVALPFTLNAWDLLPSGSEALPVVEAPPAPPAPASFADLGLTDLSADELVAMRIHGVTPDFIQRMQGMSSAPLTVDDLIAMRIHGVSPEFARDANAALQN